MAGLLVAVFLLWRYSEPPASSGEAAREERDFEFGGILVQFAFAISVLAVPVWPFETQAAATGRMVLLVLLTLEMSLFVALRAYESSVAGGYARANRS